MAELIFIINITAPTSSEFIYYSIVAHDTFIF